MPIPTPNSSETKSKFVNRCIAQIKDEYPSNQSVAICISQWDSEKFAKYEWDDCMRDQMKRGYSVLTSQKICGYIKNKNQ
jgi:hypothetical protein